jgi:anthranilate phosphoribosyltransferase
MSYKIYLEKIINNKNLSEKEASEIFGKIMSGKLTNAQIAGLIIALRVKGESINEIIGFVKEMRQRMGKIKVDDENLVDTCGTGGDGKNTFNISTVSAFVAAGAGCRIAKHGNRAISSKSGSADLLESLGVKINLSPQKVKESIEKVGIGFLFAPLFHKAMKYAAPARKEIGIKTVFNILGPLTNPAGAKKQLIGVFNEKLTEPLAHVLKNLGTKRCMLVHGEDGLDEITITGKTKITEIYENSIKTYYIKPEDFNFKRGNLKDLIYKSNEENREITISILKGEKSSKRDIVLLNAGATIYLSGIAESLKKGIEAAKESIDSGKAFKKLNHLIEFTNKEEVY